VHAAIPYLVPETSGTLLLLPSASAVSGRRPGDGSQHPRMTSSGRNSDRQRIDIVGG